MQNLAFAMLFLSLCGGPIASLKGRIVDARTGLPLAGAWVTLDNTTYSTRTNEQGYFQFATLPAGEFELSCMAAGYAVTRLAVRLLEEKEADVEIGLTPAPPPIIGEVRVNAGTFAETEVNAASESTLTAPELDARGNVLVADPVRALPALPGVTGNDDLNSKFTLRGAGLRRIGFLLDGVLVDAPAHAIQEAQGGGSVSLLNGEMTQRVTLLPGAFPVRYGDSTAGVLSFELRAGRRERAGGKLTSSLLNSSMVGEGPLVKGRGAWLVTLRRSYLNYLLHRLDQPGISFDFTDVQSKLSYDWRERHQFGGVVIWGGSGADQRPFRDRLTPNDVLETASGNRLLIGSWNYAPHAKASLQTRLFHLQGNYANRNPAGRLIETGGLTQTGARLDAVFDAAASQQGELGFYLRTASGRGWQEILSPDGLSGSVPLVNFGRRGQQQAYYLQDTWSSLRARLSVTGGVRFEHFDLNQETIALPRAALKLNLTGGRLVRFGLSRHAQFPGFDQLFGLGGNPRLRAEKASHFNVSFEQPLGSQARLVVELYRREDTGLFFNPAEDLRRAGLFTLPLAPTRNALAGNARGIELTLQRRGVSRFTGSVAYAFAQTWLRDRLSGQAFVSDFDQRHTFSAFGSWRWRPSLTLNAQWRYGSGLPRVGFYRTLDSPPFSATQRNTTRLPQYSRLDLTVSKGFRLRAAELTVLGEVLNTLGRNNLRQSLSGVERTLPFLPSGGIRLQF